MKPEILVLTFILLAGCSTHQKPASNSTSTIAGIAPASVQANFDEDSIMTNQALKSYRDGYVHATRHKAFAQSAVGAWSWKSNRTSVKHAKQNALIDCQKNNGRHEAEHPCRIINVNGQWASQP